MEQDTHGWLFTAEGYEPQHERAIESSYTVANGFLGVRASLEFPTAVSLPRTYVAGLFGQPPRPIISPVLLSAPDWLRLKLSIDGEMVSMDTGMILEETRTLDAQKGVLHHILRWRSPKGLVLRLEAQRFASQAARAVAVEMVTISVEQPATLELETPVAPAELPLEDVAHDGDTHVWRTTQNTYWLTMQHHTTLTLAGQLLPPDSDGCWTWQAAPDQPATLSRSISVTRSTDNHSQPTTPTDSAALLAEHTAAWADRWHDSDIGIAGAPEVARALRFAIYHLISTANPDDDRVSIGARALTGEGYVGHVFWDTENYLLPFYTFAWPEAARALLMYRYHMLDGARAKALRLGFKGAFYAWESADTGDEATPRGVIGPDGKEVIFYTAFEATHISADIAYAIWQYWLVTQDESFLREAGAEIIMETARFWVSRATRDAQGRYHIEKVTGPDEYHDSVNDNAYTNIMAQDNIARALEIVSMFQTRWAHDLAALRAKIALTDDEIDQWRDVMVNIHTGLDPHTGLIEQFDGFFGLEYVDLATYPGFKPTMDVVIGFDQIRKTQVIKQADVVMLLALLWRNFTPDQRRANFDYYTPRCSHGSSLSLAMHALVAARLGEMPQAEDLFRRGVAIDQDNAMGNSDNGTHIANHGGLWMAAVYGFAGLDFDANGLRFDPHLPASWGDITFRLYWRGQPVCVTFGSAFSITIEGDTPVTVTIGGQTKEVAPGETWRWSGATA